MYTESLCLALQASRNLADALDHFVNAFHIVPREHQPDAGVWNQHRRIFDRVLEEMHAELLSEWRRLAPEHRDPSDSTLSSDPDSL